MFNWSTVGWVILAAVAIYYAIKPTPPLPATTDIAGTVRFVADGDSLYIEGAQPQIRLWAIDAPEINEPGPGAATLVLKALVLGKRLFCRQQDTDHYRRIVARCELSDGRDIARVMIESDHAREWLRYSKGYYSN